MKTRLAYLYGLTTTLQEGWEQRFPFVAETQKHSQRRLMFHDRSGFLPNELNMATVCPIPVFEDHSPEFAHVLQDLADDILWTAIKENKIVHLAWSGGIDSTAIAVAFLQSVHAPRIKKAKRLVFMLNARSISEYPAFYDKYIIKDYVVVPMSHSVVENPKAIVVTGDLGDQLVTSMYVNNLEALVGGEAWRKPWKNTMAEYMSKRGVSPWMTGFLNDFGDRAPFQLDTALQFFWWYDFCTKWQEIWFQGYRWSKLNCSPEEYVKRHIAIFAHERFQQWAMWNQTTGEQPSDPRNSPKADFLKFILYFTNDYDYVKNKIKWPSGSYLMNYNYKTAIWEDFSFKSYGHKI